MFPRCVAVFIAVDTEALGSLWDVTGLGLVFLGTASPAGVLAFAGCREVSRLEVLALQAASDLPLAAVWFDPTTHVQHPVADGCISSLIRAELNQ